MNDIRQHGLAGALLRLWSDRRAAGSKEPRQMELLEVLPLGRRHLMLVRCGKERFLVGGGIDNIGVIVKVAADAEPAQRVDLCG